jgi:ubiquinone/menaquinone biosynthesis C-methylase UbiE
MPSELVKTLQCRRILRRLIYRLGRIKASLFHHYFMDYLTPGNTVLDIGAGTCNFSELLANRGFDITAVDVCDLSFVDSIRPVLFDGKALPFGDHTFDVALLIHVLHHATDPERLFSEASRVARRIVVVEDIITNPVQKYITYYADSLLNLEFHGHPHSNKSDSEWRQLFTQYGLRLLDSKRNRFMGIFKHATYHLEQGGSR